LAVVETLSKGMTWTTSGSKCRPKPGKDTAGYYIQASEGGGEPLGRWWGTGARALGPEPGRGLPPHATELRRFRRMGGQRAMHQPPASTRLADACHLICIVGMGVRSLWLPLSAMMSA
jgi:hypothetical protein